MIEIPPKIRGERFILLMKQDKRPLAGEKWRTEKDRYTYDYGDRKLIEHIAKDGNYAVLCGGLNSLVVVDFDDVDISIVKDTIKELGETFTVKTKRGFHVYYHVPGFKGGTTIDFGKGHADIRSDGQYVVGPNSVHPDGIIYRVINDREIAVVDYSKFISWLTKHGKTIEKQEGEAKKPELSLVFDIEQAPQWVHDRLNEILKNDEELNKMIRFNYVPKRFPSRSERDYAVILKLIGYGLKRYIPAIFEANPIGEKMREHPNPRHYIKQTMEEAMKKYSMKDYPEVEETLLKIHMAKDKHTLAMLAEGILKDLSHIDDEFLHDFVISTISKRTGLSKRKLWRTLRHFQEMNSASEVEKLSDLIDVELKETEYWLKPYIPRGSLIIVGGKPGSFKSNIVLMFSLLLASKTMYAGRLFKQKGQPKILVYDLENDKAIRASRVQYMIRGMGISPLDNIAFKSDFSKNSMKSELEYCKNFDIIVLDSYRRFLQGDENKSEITNSFYRNFLKPLKDMGKTVIIIHHFRKMPSDMSFAEDLLLDAFRGSTDIVSQVDIAYAVIRSPSKYEEASMSFSVYFLPNKNRQGLPIPPLKLSVTKDDGAMKTSMTASLTSVAAATDFVKESIIKLLDGDEMNKSELIHKVSKQTRYSERTVRNVLNDMKASGLIKEMGKMVSLDENLASLFADEPEEVRCL